MAAATSTRTHTRVDIRAQRCGQQTVLARLAGGDLVRARPLPPAGSTARIALVQTAAALLHGDRIEMRLELGEDARLEITDIAAMVAHDGRGGTHATLQTTARLAPGAVFVWDAKPLVLCAGCSVRRTIALELAAGATALLRDTIVLGRPGQQVGILKTRTTVRYAGVALHHETLDTSDTDVLRSPAVLHDRRVLDSVAIYGTRCHGPGVMQLDGPGSILVIPASEAADAGAIATTTFKDWQPDAQAGPMR